MMVERNMRQDLITCQFAYQTQQPYILTLIYLHRCSSNKL